MLEIGLAVAFFIGIVMMLSLVILAVRSKLVATGPVDITINDEETVTVPAGGTLLGALADAGINLPSSCGAKGTCGLCRVQVLKDASGIGTVETARITRREAAAGVRLACQVAVRSDMAIRVEDEILGVRSWHCSVRSNRNVAPLIKELILELPAGERMPFRAGSFVQVRRPPGRVPFRDLEIDPKYRPVWDKLDLWRFESVSTQPVTRAYSLANSPEECGIVMLDVRIAVPPPGSRASVPPGVVSSYLFALKPRDEVTVSGPYGHFFTTETDREMVFIGGGVGMAPMRSHIFEQLKHRGTTRKISFWYGARSRQHLFYTEDFEQLQREFDNFRWFVALSEPEPDDRWQGLTGFIHKVVLENYLRDHPAPEAAEYYLCGPPMMITATRKMLDHLGVDPEDILFDDFGG